MSSGMQNAQNFAAVVSSMVLEPSFFDTFFMFSQFWVFYGPGYGLGRGLGLPWDFQGASWGFLEPEGAPKGGLGFFGAGGTSPLAPLLALSWADSPISPVCGVARERSLH